MEILPSSRYYKEGDLTFIVVALGQKANGPGCLESLPYPY